MGNKMTRRSFLKKATFGTLGSIGAAYGGYYYAHDIEPYWLTIKRDSVESERLPSEFNNYKIVQITDTHLGFQLTLEDMRKIVRKVNQESPDLIVFTGDLFDDPSDIGQSRYNDLISILSDLKAKHGQYWIYGNHDHGGYGTDSIKEVMNQSGFTLLQNDYDNINLNGSQILLAGVDDVLLGDPRLNQLIPDDKSNTFNILLCHEPDYADQVKDYNFDLQLSGHSHGGQVQIPFYGYIITPLLGQKYVEGKTTIGERPLHLLTSRGLGTTRLPFRFLCRPEINVITLNAT
ncbi:metallophosphoesterase [Alkalibacillus salilacus]|uniref:MPP superfamily phosphohydrolase n=1 Tax=Alkalibacillus salilacus TaxID=284582 RepID=A0ABT9VGS4_9BACI|nr:metallophosphoesterase [Alkalibacillus salilacus]MDQ0160070.1 putative MPP superfamily phosphohydrolase [Alkalibacillus salilacus]